MNQHQAAACDGFLCVAAASLYLWGGYIEPTLHAITVIGGATAAIYRLVVDGPKLYRAARNWLICTFS